jgi:hypothetical protein
MRENILLEDSSDNTLYPYGDGQCALSQPFSPEIHPKISLLNQKVERVKPIPLFSGKSEALY